MARPTADSIMADRTGLLEEWKLAHAAWVKIEEFIDQRHYVRFVDPAVVRRLGIARSKVFAMVDTLVTDKPTVTRAPLRETAKAKERAEKLTKWAKGDLRRVALSQLTIPPFRAASFNLTAFGYFVMVSRWDDALWPEKPESGGKAETDAWEKKRARSFPLCIEAPHPARVLMPPMERQPKLAIESSTMRVWEVARRWPELGEELHGDPFATVELVYYVDENYTGLTIDGREAWIRENNSGLIPYTHGYASMGYEHSPTYTAGAGVASLGPSPEHLAVGILEGILDSITARDELNTAIVQLIAQASHLRIFSGDQDAEELGANLRRAGSGGIIPGPKPETEDPPQISPALFQAVGMIEQDINTGTFPAVVEGRREIGVTTATQHAEMLGTARQKFGMPIQEVNTAAGLHLGIHGQMLEEREETVTVDGIAVSGEDFEGVYDFTVDFLAKDEGAMMRERAQSMEEVQAGLRSNERHWEVTGVSDPMDEERDIWLDAAKRSPEVNTRIVQAAIAKFQARHPMPAQPPMPGGNGAVPPVGPGVEPMVSGFVETQGSPEEAYQVQQGMLQTPGAGIERAGLV